MVLEAEDAAAGGAGEGEGEAPTARDEPLPAPAAEGGYSRKAGATIAAAAAVKPPAFSSKAVIEPARAAFAAPTPPAKAGANTVSAAGRNAPLEGGKLRKLGGRFEDASGAPRLLVLEEWRPSIEELAFIRAGYRQ